MGQGRSVLENALPKEENLIAIDSFVALAIPTPSSYKPMLNPYRPSAQSPGTTPLPRRTRLVCWGLWLLGYALQFALFAGFMESWLSGRVFFNSRSADLKLRLFGLPMIGFAALSILVVLFMLKHWTIAKRIWTALATVALFGATWFGFWIYMLVHLYARMRN